MAIELDRIDHHILRILQKNCRTSAHDIGEQVGLSASATQRRISTLREQGVISKEVAVLNPQAIGRELTLLVEVILENDTPEIVQSFIESITAFEAVTQFYYVTGASDYVLIYNAKSMSEYDQFTQEVFFANPNVKTFNTKVTIRPIKVGHELPV